jgi:hypothetical protein
MRTILKISTVLSWFNLIIWGGFTSIFILGGLLTKTFPLLIAGFLLSSIILHSYAALQLHASIRQPAKPLSVHTPAGIRFIGAIALFLGVLSSVNAGAILQNPGNFLKLMQPQMPQGKILLSSDVRLMACFGLICGISVAMNVIFNFRLLRWYHFMKGMM